MGVNRIARQNNGVKTWGFSQSSPRTYIFYFRFGAFGICAALAAHWIKTNAKDDESLPAKLGLTPRIHRLGSFSVRTYRSLNVGELIKVGRDFHTWTHGNGRQCINIENWLINHGLHKEMRWCNSSIDEAVNNMVVIRPGQPVPPPRAIPPINVSLVNALRRLKDAYAYISFSGARAGHAVAAWVADDRVNSDIGALFFDPNYGEYRFATRDDFFDFFTAYYRHAYMSGWIQFRDSWEVKAYTNRVW
ncbi:YopT-type cysteine protease domain-containing protein [Microbulbifer sp. CnH-101-G]|uniref:YopT-type cysteine protease domain-containing protein n=1 Tax=Microbulbifer sp. CnH-101-G TaxID=3243393 RepID=UPI00403A75AE